MAARRGRGHLQAHPGHRDHVADRPVQARGAARQVRRPGGPRHLRRRAVRRAALDRPA